MLLAIFTHVLPEIILMILHLPTFFGSSVVQMLIYINS
jgi:hypothetical protein